MTCKSLYVLFLLLDCALCAKILAWILFSSFSHQIVFQSLWKELSLRGHQVTVITTSPMNDPSLINLTEINVNNTYKIHDTHKVREMLSINVNLFQIAINLYKLTNAILDEQLKNTQIIELLASKNRTFDLIMIENFEPILWGLSAKFKAPFIGLSTLTTNNIGYDTVGNPTHPVLYPDVTIRYEAAKMSLTQKFKNVIYNLWSRFYYYNIYLPQADIKAKKLFGEIPYIGDIAKNISLMFLNVNRFLHPIRPNVPAIIELGFMHIKPEEPLPNDLQNFLDEAQDGVVYFSLGSKKLSVALSIELRETIINAFAELPYKVLWKWESDYLPDKPENVLIRKWFPQQDILAHPNVKVFLTQGGLQSCEEAIVRGVPLIGIPMFADQPSNIANLVELGVAIKLHLNKLTKDDLKNAILRIVQNKQYKEKIMSLKELVWDQPMTGLEKAVWWTEFVIRHKGAPYFESPLLKASWNDIFMFDVIIVSVLIILIIVIAFYQLCKFFLMIFVTKHKLKNN